MGIYDRDYYRGETSYLGSWSETGRVCNALITINVIAFVLQLMGTYGPPEGFLRGFTGWFVLDPNRVLDGQVWRLITYGFLHSPASFMHILFNMLFLYWFGKPLENIYGSREFLAFYLFTVVLAGIAYCAASLTNLTPPGVALGASGAVTAVMVLFAMHFPHHTILLFFVLPIPIWLLVVFQVAQDVLGILGARSQPIAFACHLAGAAFGFLYHRLQWRVSNWLPTFSGRRSSSRQSGHLRVVWQEDNDAATPAPVAKPAAPVDEHLEAKLDQVLEKVAQHGQDSLTSGEREILFRASEIYKRRRKS